MGYKFYYKKDFSNFEHYYKLDSDGIGIHVNVTSPCINKSYEFTCKDCRR